MTEIELQVKFQSNVHKINISSEATITDLSQIIKELTNILPENQKLILKGSKLANPSQKLSEAGLKNGTKLLLVGSTPPPPQKGLRSTPHGVQDLSNNPPRPIAEKYLTVPPHSDIIAKGPPPGCAPGNSFQIEKMPLEPFIVRDKNGDVAKMSFGSDELIITSEKNTERIFYSEVIAFGIQSLPHYENQYLAVGVHIRGNEIWSYFIPKQYKMQIDIIFQSRRGN